MTIRGKVIKNKWFLVTALLALLFLLSACGDSSSPQEGDDQAPSNETSEPSEAKKDVEPVTISLVSNGAGINTIRDLEDLVTKPVRKAHPHISIELISGKSLNDIIISGDVPDLVATSNYYLYNLLDLGLASDLTELVKSRGTDLTRFDEAIIDELYKFGKNGELYGIPFAMNYGVTVYNKEIFDRFGVTYPEVGMTWEESIEIARRITREDEGVQYIGMDPGTGSNLTRAASLPVVDENDNPVLDDASYIKLFSFMKDLFAIDGIVSMDKNYMVDNIDYFLKDQVVAMQPYWLAAYTSRVWPLIEQGNDFDWDIINYPVFEDRSEVGREIDFHFMMVTPTSENKEAAFSVIEAMTTDEAQKEMNAGARLTALKDLELRKEFASSLEIYDGKDLESIFTVSPAPLPEATEYDAKIYSIISEAMQTMIKDNIDINTVLREANEKAKSVIEELKKQNS